MSDGEDVFGSRWFDPNFDGCMSDAEMEKKRNWKEREIKRLELECKTIERKLQDLYAVKYEQLSNINEFNTLYCLKVGDVIEEILKRKEELLPEQVAKKQEIFEEEKAHYEEAKSKAQKLEEELEDLDEFDDDYDEVYESWQEAKEEANTQRKKLKEAKEKLEDDEESQEYEEFHREYKEVLKQERFELDDAEKKELKKLFREAIRLCHPDIVSRDVQNIAYEVTSQLTEAYIQKNLNKVKKTLAMLKQGVYFPTKSSYFQEKVSQWKVARFEEKVVAITLELEAIKADETFKTIEEINDWDAYFDEVRKKLEEEYRALQNIENEQDKTKTKKNKENFDEDDEYWEEPF